MDPRNINSGQNVDRPNYRSALYGRYVTVHAPSWQDQNDPSLKIGTKATIKRLRGWLPEKRDAKCLDLGCGTGNLMEGLKQDGYHDVTGVDLGPEGVAIARHKGLKVEAADLRTFLSEARDEFDLICAFDVIEHLGKDELLEALDLIRKRLKPGGVLIFQTPNGVSPWVGHYRYGDLTHELVLTPGAAQSALRLTGFGDIAIREVAPMPHGIKSAVRLCLWKFIWGLCAIFNLVETGSLCGSVYTRNMLVRAVKGER